jgi:multiple sugar transport system substrate-binding protein
LVVTSGTAGAGILRDLLREWNDEHPRTPVVVEDVGESTAEQREAMRQRSQNEWGDILHLDSIYVSEFAAKGWIAKLPGDLIRSDFLPGPVATCRRRPGESELFAVPFNTDVGVVFSRGDLPDQPVNLVDLLAGLPANSRALVGQFGEVNEAFLVNVLEHALAVEDQILDPDGRLNLRLEPWNRALAPLKDALAQEKIFRSRDEPDSATRFASPEGARAHRYMRNWPFRGWDRMQSPPPTSPLTHGVLGGQNLALVASSRRADEAIDVIRFLTTPQSQRDLVRYRLVPVNRDVLTAATKEFPPLATVLRSIEDARPRPITPRYYELSTAFQESLTDLITSPQTYTMHRDSIAKLEPILRA